MLNVRRLIKGSIAALAVVAGGATATAVVSNGQDDPTMSISVNRLDKGDALQSTFDRFRLESAAPNENIWDNRAWWPASAQSFGLTASVKGDRLPMVRTRAVQDGSRLIDADYPFAAIGWQRSVAAATATTQTD
jgi:hypothetical protein